mgnify:CR=1 FL=1|jgi:UMF1 family MFS transporter
MTAAIRPDRPRTGTAGIFSWCLYDWAMSAFNTVIGTFVFSVYFQRGIYGDEVAGSTAWGLALGLSGLAVAVTAPILGAVADHGGRRKPWLAVFQLATVVPTALLWFAKPDQAYIGYALTLVVIASIAFELAGVFYNAMLPGVAPPGMIGRVSGWGWGLGYIGGLFCLVAALFGLIRPEVPILGFSTEDSGNVRATALLVALWFGGFGLPLFLFTADEPATGVSPREAVRRGLAALARTAREARRYGHALRFLVASALYRDGLNTLFAVGGLYAAGTFGMSTEEIILFAIGLNVTAGLGAAGFAFVDDRFGPKPTVLIALGGLIATGLPVLLVTDTRVFIALALLLGIFVGPAQAASRSLMARLAPAEKETEMFGLYTMTGKAVSFLGPTGFALVTAAFASQRAGMATILVLLAAGGLLLLTVRPDDAGR